MGNQVSGSTVNWSTLAASTDKKACDPSTAAELIERLGIDLPSSDDEKVNAIADSALDEQLDAYLVKLSDEEQKPLFLRFGVNPEFEANASPQSKLSALRLIASKDYWRHEWQHHPLSKRVKSWLWVHDKYRGYVHDMVEAAGQDLAKAKALLVKFDKKLERHTEFEEKMLFKFMRSQAKMTPKVLDALQGDHVEEVPAMMKEMMEMTETQKAMMMGTSTNGNRN